MIRGYVSSDEDDYDDYDFGYSEPLVIKKEEAPLPLPEIKTQEFKEKLYSSLEKSHLTELFLKAVDEGDLEALEKLVSLGVDVESSEPQEWTPLMKACVSGRFEVVQFLLEHGSNPNKHKELFTPLMACCTYTLVAENLKLNCIRLLLDNGAEVNAKDKYCTTALMYATGSGYVNIVAKLLEIPGIDVNLTDREGWTALFYAVNQNNIKLAEKLVLAGTDLKVQDKYDRTVINLALSKDLTEMAKILGYIEEKIDEPDPINEELSYRFLSELPDSQGQGGFSSDAKSILAAFNQLNVKNISLPDLLNATEKDLYDIGVKLQPNRLKILSQGIHRFHLQPWKNSSIHQIVPGVPLSLENIIAITGCVAKHLTVINASLRYLGARISNRRDKELVDLALEKDMTITLINSYHASEKLKVLLPRILKHSEQIKPQISPDFIHPCEKKKLKKFFWYSVGAAATTGFLICFCKRNFNLKNAILERLNCPGC